MNTTLVTCILAGLFLVICFFAVKRIRYWLSEGEKIKHPGYTSPHVSSWARVIRLRLGRLVAYLKVGRLVVIGKENLNYPGRLLITPNHQNEKDAVAMTAALGTRHYRFLMAVDQITPIRAPLVAWLGGIAVHENNPGASVRAAINALKAEQDSSILIFPQGRLVKDNTLSREDFFSGALMIGKHAAKKSKAPFALLPMAIYYHRRPDHATLLFKLADRFGISWFSTWFNETTYGATVAIGKPIPLSELPDDLDAATDVLFEQVKALSHLAESAS